MEPMEQEETKRQTVKFVVDKLFKSAKEWKFLYSGNDHKDWVNDIKWVKGIQYKNQSEDGNIKASFNLVWANIQKELPFMTDRPPKIYIEPMEPSDKYGAELFQMIVATKWLQRDMDKKIPEGTLNAKELGTAFYEPFWNKDLEGGLGDVDCAVVDPIECFPFAYTHELTKEKCEGFIRARNVSLGWIRKNYPKEGWRVKAQVDKSIIDRAKETASKGAGDYTQVSEVTNTGDSTSPASKVETDYLPADGSNNIHETDLKRCTLIKCYIKDGSLAEDDKGEKKDRYPNGRVITIAGGIILEDEEFSFDFFPGFVEQRNYILPSEFWGESDVTQIKEINRIYNKLFSTLSEAVRRGVYTQKFIDIRSGINPDDYVTTEDAIYPTKIPSPVTESAPQAMPTQAFNMIQMLQQTLNTISGNVDYTPPSGGDLPSGRSLAEMNEISQTRLRQKIRNMEYTIRKIASAWLELMFKNYTEDRIMRLINSATNESEWCFIFKEEDPEKAKIIREKALQETIPGTEQKDQKGQPVPNSAKKKYNHVFNMADLKKNFDVNVATGSTVSVSKYATFDQSMALYMQRAIDQQALLEAADYPNRNDVMRRMQEQAAQASQAQQQAMQQQIQLEQAKVQTQAQGNQVQAQGDQLNSQTTLQKTQMDNETKEKIKVLDLAYGGKKKEVV